MRAPRRPTIDLGLGQSQGLGSQGQGQGLTSLTVEYYDATCKY